MKELFAQQYDKIKAQGGDSKLGYSKEQALHVLKQQGIPTVRHEEWKYTRISSLFNKDYNFFSEDLKTGFTIEDFKGIRLPESDQSNELVFVNGIYNSGLSRIISPQLQLQTLEQAVSGEHKDLLMTYYGHSAKYLNDGINALNTAFVKDGIFIQVQKGKSVEHPLYIYNITDARIMNVLAQPRSFVHLPQNTELQVVETYVTLGASESLTNQVIEILVDRDARLEYYKIQNDQPHTNLVSTTHIHQREKSFVHTVTISLDGNIVRNNLNMIMDADHCEAHLYGLYFLHGKTHVDNHTLVDNRKPHCYSNEFYKGILAEHSTGIFNGKIYVQPDAQKINAYQSNKNILLSPDATVNTKPQLEILADDVKCSHGCTIGQLDEEAMFYLRSRGVSEKTARSLLVHGFAIDVLEHIRPEPIRKYVDSLISKRLEVDLHD